MKMLMSLALASVSVAAMGTAANAQPAGMAAAAAATAADDSVLGEIVVTARRRSESLQEVPQVVNAVTADTLQKLNIQQFQDIQAVVPGLTLNQANTGYTSGASLRGVSFDVNTGAQPTVAMYMNDAPVETNNLFQSMFDVGQIEVLRGPQGTTRGISAPSGGITMTTRKPDLSNIGGYVSATATDQQARNMNGAINVPIIQDVLALRAAAFIDQSTLDGVGSIHNTIRPRSVGTGERVSLSFEPNDRLNANVMYQHLDKSLTSYTQVSGPGTGPADPPISISDRAAVQDAPSVVHQHVDLVTAQMDSRIFGQHLSYVGSYQHFHVASTPIQDVGDAVPGVEFFSHNMLSRETTTQEIRLASDPAPGRFFDYTVGAFYQWQSNLNNVQQNSFNAGTFGPPGGVQSPGALNTKFIAPVHITGPSTTQETSFFGSLTLHLGPKTELSGGVRHIIDIQDNATLLTVGPGFSATKLPVPIPCSAVHFASTYPGFCDAPIPAGTVIQSLSSHDKHSPTIYNISLSHHVSRDLLVYANTGSSWRPGPTAVGVFNATHDPVLNSLTFLKPEKSTAYEVGLKSTFLDGRARLNVAAFRQKFTNLIVFVPNVPYLSNSGQGFNLSTFSFTANADALVTGFDVDGAFQITPEWNVGAQLSYADGHVTGSSLPCNDSNFDGVPDKGAVTNKNQFPAGTLVALCPGGSVNRSPLWNATVQSEYSRPVREGVDGFVRGLFTYYPKNNHAGTIDVDSYSLVNLYAGVRSEDGAWEVSLFAKNAFKDDTTLTQGAGPNTLGTLVSGYTQVTTTPRREVGVNVRYAFGSR